MNFTELMQVEQKIDEINSKIIPISEKANDAYKRRDFKAEDGFQKQMDAFVAERAKLRLVAMREYQTLRLEEWETPIPKGSEEPISILFKLGSGFQQWRGGLTLREVTPEREGTIYIKIDGMNEVTQQIEQLQIHASKRFATDLSDDLANVLRNLKS